MKFDSFPYSFKFEESYQKHAGRKARPVPFNYEFYWEKEKLMMRATPRIKVFTPCPNNKVMMRNKDCVMIHPLVVLEASSSQYDDSCFSLVKNNKKLIDFVHLDF